MHTYMDGIGTTSLDCSGSGGVDRNEDNSTVPLLLNPAYARTKSMVFDELRNFRISLKWCALDHSSLVGKLISYAVFVVLTFVVPAMTSLFARAPEPSSSSFNKLIQLPESGLAVISFLTLSAFFRSYGLRQLLLLDGLRDDSSYVRRRYARELDRAFKYLSCILLPSLSVELAHKIAFFSEVTLPEVPYIGAWLPCNLIALVVTLASWVYRTGVFLLVCVLFRLTCELQILRFEGFYKMFDRCSPDVTGDVFMEHLRIKRQLLVTSHRYRIFIVVCLVTITISQLGALLLVFDSKSDKNFSNSGDLVVCSAVQLSGFLMCLLGAARITHRAQRAVAIASRWHMAVLCASDGRPALPLAKWLVPESTARERIDACSTCTTTATTTSTDESKLLCGAASHETSAAMGTGQALVMYLQHNGGGITLFGFALDRGLLHTLFVFEMSLVLWILSKVVVLS